MKWHDRTMSQTEDHRQKIKKPQNGSLRHSSWENQIEEKEQFSQTPKTSLERPRLT